MSLFITFAGHNLNCWIARQSIKDDSAEDLFNDMGGVRYVPDVLVNLADKILTAADLADKPKTRLGYLIALRDKVCKCLGAKRLGAGWYLICRMAMDIAMAEHDFSIVEV